MHRKIDWEGQIGRRLRFRDLHVFFTVVNRGSMIKAASATRSVPSASSGVHATAAGSAQLLALGRSAGVHRRQRYRRLILRPAFSWSGTTFSSLMPLRY